MKVQLRLKLIPKLLVLLLPFFIFTFTTLPVLASTYGSGTYGSCKYGESCPQPISSISQVPDQSFLSKYWWIIFIALAFAISLWFIIVVWRRRKSKDKDRLSPTPPPRAQP